MTDYAGSVKAILVADGGTGGVNTLMTGGIRTSRELPKEGLTRSGTPSTYDATTKLMLPNLVVRQRGVTPTYDLADPQTPMVSISFVIELWLYADAAAGWAGLDTARARAYVLLHEKNIASVGRMTLANEIDDARDQNLNDACLLRADYQVITERG